MSGAKLFIEHGVIETRAALFRDGVCARFWFGPALGAESEDQRALEERRFVGRVARIDASLGAAFVDIGAGPDAFMRLSGGEARSLSEGEAIDLRIDAAARRDKGPVASYIAKAEKGAEPRRVKIRSAPREALDVIGEQGAEIIADSAELRRALSEVGMASRAPTEDEIAMSQVAFGETLDEALSESVNLPGGGALHFAENEAMTVIDVDSGAMRGASAPRLREKLIEEAVRACAVQIERRNLAGRIIIDFPSVRGAVIRERINTLIRKTLEAAPRMGAVTITGANTTILSRERRGASLWDEATELSPADPVPGRAFSLAWKARMASYAAEQRQRAMPGARLELRVDEALSAYMMNHAKLSDAFAQRFGAPIVVTKDDRPGDRDFDIVER